MPYLKKRIHLPVIWSPEEVACLIDAAPIPFYRTILMTLYGTGVRRAECEATLRVWWCMSTAAKAVRTATSCSAPICATNCAPFIAPARKPAVWLFPVPYPVCGVIPISTPGHTLLALPAAISQPRGEAKPIKDRHQVAAPRLVPARFTRCSRRSRFLLVGCPGPQKPSKPFSVMPVRIHTMMPEKHTTITKPFSNPC